MHVQVLGGLQGSNPAWYGQLTGHLTEVSVGFLSNVVIINWLLNLFVFFIHCTQQVQQKALGEVVTFADQRYLILFLHVINLFSGFTIFVIICYLKELSRLFISHSQEQIIVNSRTSVYKKFAKVRRQGEQEDRAGWRIPIRPADSSWGIQLWWELFSVGGKMLMPGVYVLSQIQQIASDFAGKVDCHNLMLHATPSSSWAILVNQINIRCM